MKNRILFFAMLILTSAGVSAQNIYQLQSVSAGDLNGTARYVGMGGAMNALGADLSVISSNPAGIGLYRSSDVAGTVSLSSQEDANEFHGTSGSYVSFDNLGFVYTMKLNDGSSKFFNIGFNYRKQKDCNMLINTNMLTSNYGSASQTWQMADLASFWLGPAKATPLTNMGNETYLIGENSANTGAYDAYGASSNSFRKAQWGSIQEYDIDFSGNINDQVYLGLTVGMYNLDQSSYTLYGENLVNSSYVASGNSVLNDNRHLTGTGVDLKAGIIVRPIQDDPLRIGFAFSTPTYYSMKLRSTTTLDAYYSENNTHSNYSTDISGYDYHLYTPWKFNLSLGSTFMNCLAVGAEYEYENYSKAKIAYDNGNYDDDDDDDEALKDEANNYLKGVSTFKIGAEWYVDKNYCIRLGYNYVSSSFKKDAFYNQFINSASLDYATMTDYMNLSAINRLTVGVGMNFGHFYVDAAYMFQNQHGDFYAFSTQNGNSANANDIPSTRIKLNRSKAMITLGYRF